VSGRVRLMWFLVHMAAIALGILAGVRFFDWAS
jgi:hypothetical protein